MSRNEVLNEFSIGTVTTRHNVYAMADEIMRLRECLAAMEAECDALRNEWQSEKKRRYEIEDKAFLHSKNVERLRRVLAALREPTEAVSKAAFYHWSVCEPSESEIISALNKVIRAAVVEAEVVAAEQEVGA